MTPVIIQKILKYTGGVTLSDGTELNGDNATKVLQKELYYKYLSNRTDTNMSNANDYVDALFAETAKLVMSKFVSEFDYKMISQYAQIFIDGGKDRTILMWMEDEKHRHMSGRPAVQEGLTMIKNIRRQEYILAVHMLVKWDGSSILIHR